MGLEPTTYRLEVCRASIAPLEHIHRVGFEPTKHNAADLKSAPFDQTRVSMLEVLPRFELGLRDSKSLVITITL